MRACILLLAHVLSSEGQGYLVRISEPVPAKTGYCTYYFYVFIEAVHACSNRLGEADT